MKNIPYGNHLVTAEDIEAVVKTLKSEFLTQGPSVPKFEQDLSDHCGAKYTVVVNSATSALHIACIALGVTKGDLVWTSPISFVASSNCALYCGASVDFVDIDPIHYNIDIKKLSEKLAIAKINGALPKVIIPVHLAGQSCDMHSLSLLAKQYGVLVLEDASHAIGGTFQGTPIGSCTFSDITVFSFHPVKIITTGEGGAALTNSEQLASKMRLLRGHGITADPTQFEYQDPEELWNYQQINLGFNYRMTDIQAALGISQLKRLNESIEARHKIADRYFAELKNLPLLLPAQLKDTYSSYHLFIIRLDVAKIKKSNKEIYRMLRSLGILVNLHYIPIYRQPYYKKLNFDIRQFPESEKYFLEALSLPIFQTLTYEDQTFVIETIKKVLS
jgi:UDP-4-amino-4,6-dideoxy-N-acetyl-beta-L-altrosamine transaminase